MFIKMHKLSQVMKNLNEFNKFLNKFWQKCDKAWGNKCYDSSESVYRNFFLYMVLLWKIQAK